MEEIEGSVGRYPCGEVASQYSVPEARTPMELELLAALKAILAVRVNKDADNIWAGSDRCKYIARAAIARATGS